MVWSVGLIQALLGYRATFLKRLIQFVSRIYRGLPARITLFDQRLRVALTRNETAEEDDTRTQEQCDIER
jgi:hypothetical protein